MKIYYQILGHSLGTSLVSSVASGLLISYGMSLPAWPCLALAVAPSMAFVLASNILSIRDFRRVIKSQRTMMAVAEASQQMIEALKRVSEESAKKEGNRAN